MKINIVVLLWCLCRISEAIDYIGGTENYALVNDTITLRCQTLKPTPVDWWYQTSPTHEGRQLCINGVIVYSQRSRMSISSPLPGDYHMVIKNVTMSDTGLYTCIEDIGNGPGRTVIHLNVVTELPTTTQIVTTSTTHAVTTVTKYTAPGNLSLFEDIYNTNSTAGADNSDLTTKLVFIIYALVAVIFCIITVVAVVIECRRSEKEKKSTKSHLNQQNTEVVDSNYVKGEKVEKHQLVPAINSISSTVQSSSGRPGRPALSSSNHYAVCSD